MVFVAIPPREEPWTGSPEPAQLQEYAWNHFQRLSWAIANNLEELENIALPLKRWERQDVEDDLRSSLKRLRSLSLLDGDGNSFFLKDDERPNLVRNLPPSLENLRMTMVSPIKGSTFGRLLRLRTLHLHVVLARLDSEADELDPEAIEEWVDTDTAEVYMRGLSSTLTRLELTLIQPERRTDSDVRVLAVTLAPADGWDSPGGPPGARPANYRQVEHERREEESRTIAAALDAESADMNLHLAGLSGAAPRAPPAHWLVDWEPLHSKAAAQSGGAAAARAAPAATQEPPEEWLMHWQALSSGALARSDVAAVVAAAPAASPCCTVCMTANQVSLRSSAPDGIADTAAGLDLEMRARVVVFELTPGGSKRSSEQGGPPGSQSEMTIRYLAAWIRASGARSVQLTSWREPGDPADAELPAVMALVFCPGKRPRHGMPRRLELAMQPWLTQVCAQHRLKCTPAMNPDGATACGLRFEPVP